MVRARRSRRKLTSKKPLLILSGAVALLILILLSLTLFVDMNQFKPSLETEISKALGRQVQFGDAHLAIFSGGVTIDNVSIADDPAFSHSPFMTAKQLTVGVSLLPLIFSKKLEVRSFTAVEPDVSLLRSASGVWNFSSLTGGAKSASKSDASPATIDFSVEKLAVKNGRINLATAGPGGARAKPQVYEDVDLEASDLSYTSKFPFHFSAKTLGNGAIKIDGKAGPMDPADASLTPLDAKISMQHMEVASSGFIDPSAGLAGLIGFAGDLNSDGHQLSSKGSLNAEKIKLAAAGSPSPVSVNVDYDTNFDLKRQAGEFKLGEVHIGKSLAHLSGTYEVAGASATVQIKLVAKAMSVADVEGILPALGVKLPPGSAFQSGTLDVNLVITGPIDKLTITGPISLSNAKLAGYNLKSKLGALGSFAGIGGTNEPDTDIQTLAADMQMDPSGTQAQNLTIVVPSIGTITGKGSLDSGGHLDCRMLAKLVGVDKNPVGAMTSVVTSFGSGGKMEGGGIPFLIQGTTSDPIFLPDVAGMAGNLGKGAVRAPASAVGAATGAIGGLFGKKKKPQQ
jgi:AsmA protein